ncbi:MAG: carbon-nitrogen hydrolase family protein [Candidatus Hydrogenedentota bacterium]|nr:MAG: carbon-nitrogen hydrolase family protein [Candidatus Hydrogenedentota bacterium]
MNDASFPSRSTSVKVSVIQFNSRDDENANVERLLPLLDRAVAAGAKLVALPETVWFRGRFEEAPGHKFPDPFLDRLRAFVRERKFWLYGGTLAERIPGEDSRRFNTGFFIDPSGEIRGRYRKVHLFDIDLPDTKVTESRHTRPGEVLTLEKVEGWTFGQMICYDVRFPEAWLALRLAGMEAAVLPANFTKKTGEAHWEVLVRARAIENQVYILAAGQWGVHPGLNVPAFGHSMIVDPWGRILASASGDEDAILTAELDRETLERVRREMPVLQHRRPSAYRLSRGNSFSDDKV